jgi:hypothetical protein
MTKSASTSATRSQQVLDLQPRLERLLAPGTGPSSTVLKPSKALVVISFSKFGAAAVVGLALFTALL